MIKTILARLGTILCCSGFCLVKAGEPESVFQEKQAAVAGREALAMGDLIVWLGQSFLETPYESHSLEHEGSERLVLYMRAFDCFTFMENVLAMSRVLKERGDFAAFAAELKRIRYRGGIIAGYPSRLHYTCDWGYDNARKGLLRDVTVDLGGVPMAKPIHFMSRHREAYPQLADGDFYEAIRRIEEAINARPRHYLPKERIAAAETHVRNGDIIAITSAVDGLDVAHVGFAVRQDDRIHLLHASTSSRKVEITPQPLAAYLASRDTHTGIMVFRPLEHQGE